MPELTGHRDLTTYLRILWRWRLLFVVCVVAVPLAAYLIESSKPKVYRSSALVGINQATVNTALVSSGNSFSTNNITAIAQLVTTTPVARIAAGLLHPPANPRRIVGEVSASGDTDTNFLTITAEDRRPRRAAAIANSFAKAISLNRRSAAIAQIDSTIAGLQAQLSHLSPNNTTTRPQLKQQITQLLTARSTQGSDAAVLQAATPSGSPAGPQVRRSVEIGLVIGLLLAFGAVSLAESADRRLRTPDDLEGMTDLPVLATIAPTAFSGKLETTKEDNEAFHMLRTALMFFNFDRSLKSVVVTSPGEQDGKTTVATRLALVAARSSLNVILVDADLRRAQVGARLGIEAQAGLGAVLAHELPLSEALVDYPIDAPGSGRLAVLPAGRPPPNPAALIGSGEMPELIRQLESEADLVIFDTPAALAVSDPLPLMGSVSGVVLVARMNRSSRERIRRLQRIIGSAQGTLLGVVATGVSSGPGYYDHYSTKYYTQNGVNGHRSHSRFRRRAKKKDGSEVQPASVADTVARDARDREQRRRARQRASYDVQPASAADAAAQDVGDRQQRRPKAEGHNPSQRPAPPE
jgi:tyrosine-protein kinase